MTLMKKTIPSIKRFEKKAACKAFLSSKDPTSQKQMCRKIFSSKTCFRLNPYPKPIAICCISDHCVVDTKLVVVHISSPDLGEASSDSARCPSAPYVPS